MLSEDPQQQGAVGRGRCRRGGHLEHLVACAHEGVKVVGSVRRNTAIAERTGMCKEHGVQEQW